jgi:hypothetical protein
MAGAWNGTLSRSRRIDIGARMLLSWIKALARQSIVIAMAADIE